LFGESLTVAFQVSVLVLFEDGSFIIGWKVSRIGLRFDVSNIDEFSESDQDGSLEKRSGDNSWVLGKFQEGIDSLDIGQEHVVGEGLQKFLGFRGGDSVVSNQVSDEKSGIIGSTESESVQVHFSDELFLWRGFWFSSNFGDFSEDFLKNLFGQGSQGVDDLNDLLHGILGFGLRGGKNLEGKRFQDSWQLLGQFVDVGLSVEEHVWNVHLEVGESGRLFSDKGHLWESESELLVFFLVGRNGNRDSSSLDVLEGHVLLSDGHDVGSKGRIHDSSF
jgi:hypothetical protein